jgi:crotonobetainyl-CoA:carnitine CoA-transferase CaiB-like acyl-CoA transferase
MEAPTVVPALINDYITGYLVAIGVVAALGAAKKERIEAFLWRSSWW